MNTPLRYVVLWHSQISAPHFDLMVETYPGSQLATWRLSKWPIESTIDAARLKDHRRIYLDFEGDLSERRGSVERIEQGNCDLHIGENAVWVLTLSRHQTKLKLAQLNGDQWLASMA